MSFQAVFNGIVGGEPDTHTFSNGDSVTTFSVAVSQGYYDKTTRAWVDKGTMWVRVRPYGNTATFNLKNIHKGVSVMVAGSFGQRFYTTRDGVEASSLECVARSVGVYERPPKQQSGYANGSGYAPQRQAGQASGDPWADAGGAVDDEWASPEF